MAVAECLLSVLKQPVRQWMACPFPYHTIRSHFSEHTAADRNRRFLITGVASEMEYGSKPVKSMITFAYICMLIGVTVTPGDR